jgi:probable phosphomutase (TIGR03848 family)
MTQLLLIRHATNDSLKSDTLAGWTPGVHLNDEGRAQAQALAARLEGVPIAAIYSSPLERAVQTAEPLAQARGLQIHVRDGLGELHVGDWSGGNYKELAKTETWQLFQVRPSGTRLPNGETGQEMQARAVAELDAICAAHPADTVAVISHADVIKAILCYYVGAHLDQFQRIAVSPASISVVWVGKFGARVFRLNDTGRTDDLIPPKPEPESEEQKTEE